MDNSHDPFKDPSEIFPFLDAALWAVGRLCLSETKCRKMGWFGVVDTSESVFKTFQEFPNVFYGKNKNLVYSLI